LFLAERELLVQIIARRDFHKRKEGKKLCNKGRIIFNPLQESFTVAAIFVINHTVTEHQDSLEKFK